MARILCLDGADSLSSRHRVTVALQATRTSAGDAANPAAGPRVPATGSKGWRAGVRLLSGAERVSVRRAGHGHGERAAKWTRSACGNEMRESGSGAREPVRAGRGGAVGL